MGLAVRPDSTLESPSPLSRLKKSCFSRIWNLLPLESEAGEESNVSVGMTEALPEYRENSVTDKTAAQSTSWRAEPLESKCPESARLV